MPKREYNKPQPIYRSRRERQRKKKTNWLPIVLLVLAFIVAAAAGALFASSSLFDEKPVAKKTEMMVSGDKTVVMLMGVDEREGDVGRSDTLMIATLDPKKKKAAILSIPRDTRVKIQGHGFDKINAAYAYGGHKLTQSTVLVCLLLRFPLMVLPLVLMVLKETFMSVTGLLVIRRTGVVISADWHGKAATVLLYATMVVHIFWENISDAQSALLIGACVVMIAISFFLYGRDNVNALKQEKAQREKRSANA